MRPALGSPVGVRGAWLLLFAGSCTVADPDPDWIARQQAATVEVAGFALPAVFAPGFDAPEPGRGLGLGDEVVYGLRLDERGVTRDWYVHVVVVEAAPEISHLRDGARDTILRVEARVHDAEGALLGNETLILSAADLTNGLARACRGEAAPAMATPGLLAPVPESVRAMLALQNLLRVVRDSDLLFDVMWQVLDKPSLWSILVNLGVRVQVASHFDAARPVPAFRIGDAAVPVSLPTTRDLPAWELPMELKLNGAPALRSVVTVVDPDSPLGLGAGVVGLRAFRPSDPTVTFTMRLLAARRGRPN